MTQRSPPTPNLIEHEGESESEHESDDDEREHEVEGGHGGP